MPIQKNILLLLTAFTLAVLPSLRAAGPVSLLNVSYDVTREFYQEYNPLFAASWKKTTGEDVTISQSHGGSSKQARSVLDGLEADVVTMNQATDIQILAKSGLVAADWESRLPNKSAPYTTTIVFVVRKGNPKAIHDWPDLIRPGTQLIIPNPKTSGNGRYTYLAAWGFALKKEVTEAAARDFVTKLLKNVPVLDTGGRAATTTFAQRGIGDVLLTFENEFQLIEKEFGAGGYETVVPSISILAEPPVSVVDKVVEKHGTRRQAEAYLKMLWSDEAQELAARHGLRPQNPAIAEKHAAKFPELALFTVNSVFGSLDNAQKKHFDDGGEFDRVYEK